MQKPVLLSVIFFELESGSVQVVINDENKRVLNRGNCFGELALLYNAPRSATIQVLEESSFWAIDRKTFKTTLEEIKQREYAENRKFIEKVHFFSIFGIISRLHERDTKRRDRERFDYSEIQYRTGYSD